MTKPLEEYYRNLQPLDVQDIQQRVIDMKQRLDFFESVLRAEAVNRAIQFTYEDLFFSETFQQSRQIGAIWNFLGIPPLELKQYQFYLSPREVKINSAVTYAWLPNASEIQEYCGNDVTGWLYA